MLPSSLPSSLLSSLLLLFLLVVTGASKTLSLSIESPTFSQSVAFTWQRINPLVSGGNLNSLAFGGGYYIAVGTYPSTLPSLVVLSSTDLISWNSSLLSQTYSNEPLVYYEDTIGSFLIILPSPKIGDSANSSCFTSFIDNESHISWTLSTTPAPFYQCSSGQGLFLCSSYEVPGLIFTSTDGITWTEVPFPYLPNSSLVSQFLNDTFFIYSNPQTSNYEYSLCIYFSTNNLSNWEQLTCFNNINYTYPINSVYDLKLYNATTLIASLGDFTNDQYQGILVISQESGNSLEWTPLPNLQDIGRIQEIAISPNFPGIIYALVVVSSFQNAMVYSTDGGVTWSPFELALPAWEISSLVVAGDIIAVVGPRGFIEYTQDGVDWTRIANGFAPTTTYQLLSYPSVSFPVEMDKEGFPIPTPTEFLVIASNDSSSSLFNLYENLDNGITWNILTILQNQVLEWFSEFSFWISYSPGLSLSTNLRSWTEVSILRSGNSSSVQFIAFWPGIANSPFLPGWIIATSYYENYTCPSSSSSSSSSILYELMICDKALKGDCYSLQKGSDTLQSLALGGSILINAIPFETTINYTSLPLQLQGGTIAWDSLQLPIDNLVLNSEFKSQPKVFFANGLFVYRTSKYVLTSPPSIEEVGSEWRIAFDYSRNETVQINMVTWLSDAVLWAVVDSTGNLFTSTDSITWSSSLISNQDSGINHLTFMNGVYLAVNSQTDSMYRMLV